MEIRDFVANRSFSGNGLWQWYEKPGYRVPRFYRRLGLVGAANVSIRIISNIMTLLRLIDCVWPIVSQNRSILLNLRNLRL
jgi:hypothetical protein